MIDFVKKINKEIENRLQIIDLDEPNIISKSQKSVHYINNTLRKLKVFIANYSFKDKDEEIQFFKKIKPKISSQLIYFITIYKIESHRPMGSLENQKSYLRKELNKLTEFYNIHQEFYQYYRTNSTYFDDRFFIRDQRNSQLYHDGMMICSDPEFSTSHDYMVANIIANDRLEIYINNELELLIKKTSNPNWEQLGIFDQIHFQWTDSKASLIELIYALYATGSINSGQKDIRELALFFEKAFNVKLTDIYRTYSELKIRSNPTKYLDTLKTAFLKKINEDL